MSTWRERPHTHTQYHDRWADEMSECRPAEHHYIDGEADGVAICSRCGKVVTEDDEP